MKPREVKTTSLHFYFAASLLKSNSFDLEEPTHHWSKPWMFTPELVFLDVPSGKLTWQWKITIFNGKIHYKWLFSIAMLNYQRVLGPWRTQPSEEITCSSAAYACAQEGGWEDAAALLLAASMATVGSVVGVNIGWASGSKKHPALSTWYCSIQSHNGWWS